MNKKMQLTSIGVLLLYALHNYFPTFPFVWFKVDYQAMPIVVKSIYLIGYELVFASIIYFIYRKIINESFKDFFKNKKTYMKKYIDYWFLAFGLMALANITIGMLLPNSTATNQEAIVEMFKVVPIYTIISATLFAPIVEELIFRLTLKNIFQNKYLFIIISGLLFGTLHVIGTFKNFLDLIYIIPYSIPGFVFAYVLYKSKNIFVPITLHFLHNTFMILLQIVLLFFL